MKQEELFTIFGHRVRIVPREAMPPVLQISHDFPHCSPAFRAEWNAWALERFGRDERLFLFQYGPAKFACMTEEMHRALIREAAEMVAPAVARDIERLWFDDVEVLRRVPQGGVVSLQNYT
jgi:hypothetical protein